MLKSRTGRGGGVWQLGKSGVKRQGRHPSERPPPFGQGRQKARKAQGKEGRRHKARKIEGTRQGRQEAQGRKRQDPAYSLPRFDRVVVPKVHTLCKLVRPNQLP